MEEISYTDSLHLNDPVYIDVRSPGEFLADHIPGALNLPLFDDDERKEIGTIFNRIGQENAIVRGSEIAGGKLGDIISEISRIRDRDIVIYCFRGGMRSSSLVSLLASLDYKVYKLKYGYKGYRSYINERLVTINIDPRAFILQGLTGTGKSEIIRNISNAIDLEKMAGHRSSVFGGIGLTVNTQKMFETLLLTRIEELKSAEYVIMEGESRKIGDIHIPNRVLYVINNSPAILIRASMERRVKILTDEYIPYFNINELIPIVQSLEQRIGKNNSALLIEYLEKRDIENFTVLLLEKYYDPLYMHTMKKMSFIAEIENTDTAGTVRKVGEVIRGYIKQKSLS